MFSEAANTKDSKTANIPQTTELEFLCRHHHEDDPKTSVYVRAQGIRLCKKKDA